MIQITRDTAIVDVDRYDNYLNDVGYLTYYRKDLEISSKYLLGVRAHYAYLAARTMQLHSNFNYYVLERETIYRYLTRVEHCPASFFHHGRTKDFSLDMKRSLQPCIDEGYAVEFLTYYCAFSKTKKRIEDMEKLLGRCTAPVGKDAEGNQLYKMPFFAKQDSNLRFTTVNENVIGIPRDLKSIFHAEDGYCLVWGDFEQSDWRVAYSLFINSKEDEDIMNSVDDKYEAIARVIARRNGVEFNLEEFKAQRPMYKTLVLAAVYGKRGSKVKAENDFLQMMGRFLSTCERYMRFVNRLLLYKSLNLPIYLKSFFGHVEAININVSDEQLLHKGLNTPNQSCTSELIIMQVNSIMDTVESLGYGPDDFRIFFVRHDEPIFIMKKSLISELGWIFKEHEDIQVEDWMPLKMPFYFGTVYSEKDPELTAQYEESCAKHKDKIHTGITRTGDSSTWMPLQDILLATLATHKLEDSTIATLFFPARNEKHTVSIPSTDDNKIMITIAKMFNGIVDKLISLDVCQILILSNDYEASLAIDGGLGCTFRKESSSRMTPALRINRTVVTKFCREHNLPLEREATEDDVAFTCSVKKSQLMSVENRG